MNRRTLLSLIIFTLFISAAFSLDKNKSCWRDYASGQPEVNYEKAMAGGTLVPDRVDIGGRVLKAGITEKEIVDALGLEAQSSTDWVERDVQSQCEYLVELFRPTMFPYIFMGVRDQKLSGLFRTADWSVGDLGTLTVFFKRSSENDQLAKAWLFELKLTAVPAKNVQRIKGESYVLKRNGHPGIKWDVSTNRVFIDQFLSGGSGELSNQSLKPTNPAQGDR